MLSLAELDLEDLFQSNLALDDRFREADATIAILCELIRRVGGIVVPSLHVAGNWCWRDDDERLLAILSADEAAQLSNALGGATP